MSERCESCGIRRTSIKGWLRWEDDVVTCPKCSPTKQEQLLELADEMAEALSDSIFAMRADGAGCLRGRARFEAMKLALYNYDQARKPPKKKRRKP